jgi:cell division protein ZapA (FtsZ GTPase activity inhibitor)
MKNEQLRSIDVEIAGRFYPVFVNDEEEKVVLALAKQINDEVDEMLSRYMNKLNKQDVMSMLLLTYAKKMHDVEQLSTMDALTEKVDHLFHLLEDK